MNGFILPCCSLPKSVEMEECDFVLSQLSLVQWPDLTKRANSFKYTNALLSSASEGKWTIKVHPVCPCSKSAPESEMQGHEGLLFLNLLWSVNTWKLLQNVPVLGSIFLHKVIFSGTRKTTQKHKGLGSHALLLPLISPCLFALLPSSMFWLKNTVQV